MSLTTVRQSVFEGDTLVDDIPSIEIGKDNVFDTNIVDGIFLFNSTRHA